MPVAGRSQEHTTPATGIKPSPSTRRAAQLLEYLARRRDQSFSVSELARDLGLNRATCQAVLMALDEASLVRRDLRTKAYSLGPALIPLGDAALSSLPVVDEARPEVERLASTTGVEAVAAIVVEHDLLIVALAGTPQRFAVRVGQTVPMAPPFGAAFVAWSDEARIEAWLAGAGAMSDEQREHYLAALRTVQERGYSVTLEIRSPERLAVALRRLRAQAYRTGAAVAEHHLLNQLLQEEYVIPDDDVPGKHRIEQVSAPVFDDQGDVALTLGLAGFAHDLTLEQLAGYVAPLLSATARLTARLGGRRPAA
jgi:DNA-binding IclR family transcriptional regulator